MNPCKECPHHELALSSGHHQKCIHPAIEDKQFEILALLMSGKNITITSKDANEEFKMIELNAHGVREGWCNWPIDFDPIWVEACGLRRLDEMK